jgi:alkylation response protein AidB-like acyl-CoA dehydrogenase
VAAVVTRAARAIAELRDQRRLYDAAGGPAHPAGGSDWNRAPLADAPDRPYGTFSRSAEEAIGEAGLWGLLVPEQFGGAGCSMQELARVITRFAADVPTAAGMLSVHSSIGAVAALSAFGTPNQQERHLPGLAQGRPLSIFGATEPDAGCDLHAIRSRLDRHQGRLLLSGTKMFITGATHGRLVKLLALLDGRPAVVLVRLPDTDTPSFRLRHYRLHPLKHAHNAALEFTQHEVNEEDILQPPEKARDATMPSAARPGASRSHPGSSSKDASRGSPPASWPATASRPGRQQRSMLASRVNWRRSSRRSWRASACARGRSTASACTVAAPSSSAIRSATPSTTTLP